MAAAARKIEAMLKAIDYNASMKQRMAALEAEKLVLQSRLDQPGSAPRIRLHPNLSDVYTDEVARLADALNAPETKAEAGNGRTFALGPRPAAA